MWHRMSDSPVIPEKLTVLWHPKNWQSCDTGASGAGGQAFTAAYCRPGRESFKLRSGRERFKVVTCCCSSGTIFVFFFSPSLFLVLLMEGEIEGASSFVCHGRDSLENRRDCMCVSVVQSFALVCNARREYLEVLSCFHCIIVIFWLWYVYALSMFSSHLLFYGRSYLFMCFFVYYLIYWFISRVFSRSIEQRSTSTKPDPFSLFVCLFLFVAVYYQ